MTAQEEINQAFNKFVYDRIENDFIDEIVKLELWKSQEISIKKSESNEILNQLVEFAIREPEVIMKIFVAIAAKVEGEQRKKLVEAIFLETRLWHISYHAKARPLDKGRRNITQFLGDLYLHSLISIGEIRASLDELLEYRKESYNSSTATACVLLERVGKKFALEERAQYAVKETYESQSAHTKLEKAKFGTDEEVRNEIDTQLKYQWMYLKDYNTV
ncbi:hypothetical protein PRIPAC_73722 [Pristionchus pacificus]|uniref:Uncharacterized protein n=1 Tax=Pristionchus pacificus TaxID=54126 RepID=A0A2A6CZE9_PRIPA|nr:hypothetical protein PRIPAC_73722 [Pristionchus pacificus]|eukprot:PDM83604.1 hypothetical protein PRIPAC_30091 [Pristionchus pacificus]